MTKLVKTLWYNKDMLLQSFILFLLGLLCILGSFYRGVSYFLKLFLRILGSGLMSLPLILLLYFLFIIFKH